MRDVFAEILSDLLVGQSLLGRAIFEAERVCATLGGAIPVTTLVRVRDISDAWSGSATLLF
jgi:hypothetical protein